MAHRQWLAVAMGQFMRFRDFWTTGVAVVALASVAAPAYAQQITSGVRGTITDAAGAPLAGASITVTDTRTNYETTTSTSAGGQFVLSGLETGGPYSVTIAAEGFQTQRLDDLILSLGDTSSVSLSLNPADDSEEIVVIAARDRTTRVALGPNAVFNAELVEGAPTITRDLRDTLRFDPRLNVTANANGTQQNVSCLGGNNRSNSFTIDGVAQGDSFGLNASAFANRFSNPYPLNATRQLSVEYAPFDVQYANFSGCNINVVTKSGSNEFHGSGFGEYSSDGLTGERAGAATVGGRAQTRNFRWGAEFGGALIKDRVFFYGAYEEQKLGGSPVAFAPIGANVGQAQNFISASQVDAIAQRIQSVYGFDPGGIVTDQTFATRKILTRWDFVLAEGHKLAFTYSRFNEAQIQGDDGPNSTTFAFGSNFQTQGTTVQTYSARLFSQWTDNLSTEIRASRSDLADVQNPLGGGEAQSANPIPRIVIGVTADGTDGTTNNAVGVLIAGPGFSRAANDLRNQTDQFRGLLNYTAGQHTFTVGYDWNQVDVFNLFVQNATGTLNFSSLANFNNNILNPTGLLTSTPTPANVTNGTLAGIFAQGRGGNEFIGGAGALWSRAINSFYGQDKWQPTDNLTVTLGLRYDRYSSGATPAFNQNFLNRYGFSNEQTFQNLKLWQPRLGVSYDAPWDVFGKSKFQFGAGVFGGGEPGVWFSNAFSNTGGSFASVQSTGPSATAVACTPAQLAATFQNGQFTGIPQCILGLQAAGFSSGQGPVNAVDPNIKLPSVVRANFQFEHVTDFDGAANGLFDDWELTFSYIHSAFRNAFRFEPLSQFEIGQTSIGFPRYVTVDPTNAGCGLRFAGVGQGFTGTYTTACNGAASRNGDILLTNTLNGSGNSDSLAILAAKTFDYSVPGLNTPASLGLNIGYSFTNAQDASNNGATTAASGVTSTIIDTELNELPIRPSGFFNGHNITFTAQSRHEFIRDFATKIGLFLQARSGQRFSLTSQGGSIAPALNSTSFYSQYIPTAPLAYTGAFNIVSTATANGVTTQTGFFNTADPNVALGATRNVATGVITNSLSPAALAQLNAFLLDPQFAGSAGQILPRNAFQNPWFVDLDLRFAQEIPTPIKGFRLEAYSTINNFLNLVANRRNVQRGFGDRASPVGLQAFANPTNATPGTTSQVVINSFTPNNLLQTINTSQSLWQVNFGLKFEF